MALTEDYVRYLEDLFAACENNASKLNTWEQGFINDQKARYEQYGAELSLSPKQRAVLTKIDDKLHGGQ